MKIGFVATEVGHQTGGVYMGGNVNNVVTISKTLASRGHDVAIVTTTPRDAASNPTAGLQWADVYEHQPQFDHGTPGYFASFCSYAIRTASRLRRRGDLDLLTTHSGFSLWGLVARGVGTVTDCPTAHVQYCPVEQPSGSRLYDTLQHPWFSRRYLAGIDELVGISPSVTASLKRVAKRDPIRTIHPALDTDEYAPVQNDEKADIPTITYLGSLKPQKGLDVLVDAFDQLRKTNDCRLRLGLEARSERAESALLRKIRSDPDIAVTGIVENVPAFLARSHVFAVPFRTTMGPADYPMAALEAMSCGVPIVATDVGGLGQLISDSRGGIQVGTPDSGRLAAGLANLLFDDESRAEAGANARRYIEQQCSVEAITGQYTELHRSLTGG